VEGSVRNPSPPGGWHDRKADPKALYARVRFTREYKAQAVQHLIESGKESGKPLVAVAAELDVSPGQLSQGRNEQLAAGSAEALAQKTADEAEMLRLRRAVKRLEDENLILRKAAAFFARGIA
jgi:transposase